MKKMYFLGQHSMADVLFKNLDRNKVIELFMNMRLSRNEPKIVATALHKF